MIDWIGRDVERAVERKTKIDGRDTETTDERCEVAARTEHRHVWCLLVNGTRTAMKPSVVNCWTSLPHLVVVWIVHLSSRHQRTLLQNKIIAVLTVVVCSVVRRNFVMKFSITTVHETENKVLPALISVSLVLGSLYAARPTLLIYCVVCLIGADFAGATGAIAPAVKILRGRRPRGH